MPRHSLSKLKLGPTVREWLTTVREEGTPHPLEPTPFSQQEREDFFLTHEIPKKVRTEFDLSSEHSFTDSGEEDEEPGNDESNADLYKDEGIDEDQDYLYLNDYDEADYQGRAPNIYIQPPLGAMSTVYFYPKDLRKFVILEEEAERNNNEGEIDSRNIENLDQVGSVGAENEILSDESERPVYLSELKDFMIAKKKWNCIVVYNMPRNFNYLDVFGKFGKLLHSEPGIEEESAFLWYSSTYEAEWVSKMMNNKRVQDPSTKKWKSLRCWRLFDFEEEEDKKEFEEFAF